MKTLAKLASSVALSATLATGLVAATATSASANVWPCGWINAFGQCTTVTGINPGSRLRIHTQPNYTSEAFGSYYNGDTLAVDCWTLGAGDADGHGWRYWMWVDDSRGNYGYVNDWYLTTGAPSTWASKGIESCGW